jgi:hypothetical protein
MLMVLAIPYQGYVHGCTAIIIYKVSINTDAPFLASKYADS